MDNIDHGCIQTRKVQLGIGISVIWEVAEWIKQRVMIVTNQAGIAKQNKLQKMLGLTELHIFSFSHKKEFILNAYANVDAIMI